MAITFTKIASYTAPSNQTNINFSSIPATYTDLYLAVSLRSTYASSQYVDCNIIFNGISSSYYEAMTYGTGSGVPQGANTNGGVINWPNAPAGTSTASVFGGMEIIVPNYSNTSYSKSLIYQAGSNTQSTSQYETFGGANWLNTAAINQITLTPGAGQWITGSMVTLYGILKA